MNCAECKELLVAYVEGLLDESQKEIVAEHLNSCTACQAELKELTDLRDRLVNNGKALAKSNLENKVLERIIREQNVRLKTVSQVSTSLKIRRIIMKSRIVKLAAAAVIIVVAFIALYPFTSGTPTFAQVIQPILNAQTAILDIIVGDEEAGGPIIHDMLRGSRIRRTLSNVKGAVSIIDLETGKILSLESGTKEAVYFDLKGLPSIPNYIEKLRSLITKLQDDPNFVVEELGEQEIVGQRLIGFRAKQPKAEITIWADPETALPVRIEQIGGQMKVICKNLVFDVPMDEELFSMDVPPDYKLRETKLDLQGSTEQDFIEGLRVLAEVIGDGVFPDDVSVGFYIKNAAKLGGKINALDISDSEKTELGMKLARHLLFIRFFKGEGEWHYAGVGVEFGDADTAIFWYRPKDSETWRVIYGDLHVEDVAEEDLPKPELSEKQAKIIRSSGQWQKQEFVGSEKDVWHITASGDIIAHSDITLTKMPQDASSIYIKLPYSCGVLESVTLNEQELPFSQVIKGRYELELPTENLLEGQASIECIWKMPLEALTKVDYGYRINLQGLIPVEGFTLSVVLEPDCGFKYSKDPSQTQITLFKTNKLLSMMDNASCGLPVDKSN